MIRKQMFFYLLLAAVLSAPGPALAGTWNGNKYYWTFVSLTPTEGGTYNSGTQIDFTLTIEKPIVASMSCTVATTTSLTSSPWAIIPTNSPVSMPIGSNTQHQVKARLTVGVATSTIRITGTCGVYGTFYYQFTVTGTAAPSNYVKITGITETISGNFQTMGGTTNESISSGNLTACVYTSASNGNYYLRIDGASDSGGVFYLVKGTDKFPVTITWNSTTLTPGTDVLFSGGSSSETCGGSTNATMVISASSAEVLKVPGSATQYLDNFVITVTHPDEI